MSSSANLHISRGHWTAATTAVLLTLLSLLIVPASARAAGSAYAANPGDNTVSQYGIALGGGLAPLSPATVATGSEPVAVAVSPNGKNAYVATDGAAAVSQYDIDPLTGKLSPKAPAAVPAGTTPVAVAVSPDGDSAYVANFSSSDVSQYDIDPLTGALTPKTPGTASACTNPHGVAVSPDGRSAYVPCYSGTVSQYDIDPLTGVLIPKSPATVAAGTFASGVAVSPDGSSAYVVNNGSATVSQYDVNSLTGALSPKTPPTAATGSDPSDVAIGPNGKSAYVSSVGGDSVYQYDVTPVTGTLMPKGTASVPAATDPRGLAVSADGQNAYAAGSVLSMYDIDPLTGSLSPKSPAAVPTGSGAYDVALGPFPLAAPPAQASTLTLAPKASANPVGGQHTVTATVKDGSGQPAAGVTVRFSVSGANSASGVATTDTAGQAQFTYTGTSAGTDTISAFADNNSDGVRGTGEPEDTAAKVWFASLARGAFVIGDGNAAPGSTVTFWGSQWAKLNSLSSGPAPTAFKGFADSAANPPACGSGWNTGPGNSSDPPPAVPSVIAVIVSSRITKSGPTISGNSTKVVAVKTNPGYAPNPGHPGTGTVIGEVCSG